jgi:hypothetical protein
LATSSIAPMPVSAAIWCAPNGCSGQKDKTNRYGDDPRQSRSQALETPAVKLAQPETPG